MNQGDGPGLAPRYGTWIQTERKAHEEWAQFLTLQGAAAASRVLHLILARMTKGNVYIISQGELAKALGVDVRTVRRGVALLQEHNWITTANVGGAKSGVKAYIVEHRIAWQGPRAGLRTAHLDAQVHLAEAEQEYLDAVDAAPLHRIPAMFADEQQLPSGEGMAPVSQGFLEGMEPDLPARVIEPPRETLRDQVSNLSREQLEALLLRQLGN